MTNISNTAGSITVKSTNKEVVRTIFNLLSERGGKWFYSTYIGEYDLNKKIDFDGKYYSLSESFLGYGRWSYRANSESMVRLLLEDGVSQETMELLTNNEFTIYFDYNDEERGSEWAERVESVLIHKAGNNPTETEYDICYVEKDCRCVYSLIELCNWCCSDALYEMFSEEVWGDEELDKETIIKRLIGSNHKISNLEYLLRIKEGQLGSWLTERGYGEIANTLEGVELK